ncbi:MAG: hypothetical protein JWM10_2681, partial [Myxococcaceae bacterium]|nr:hypothetical protein [Myxococcaceae bacterium]
MLTRADRIRSLALAAVLLAEVTVAAARVRPDRAAPFSGRFSWSMFAGPITARCHHALAALDAAGRPVAAPLPRDNPALRALLVADTPARFSAVAPWFAPYADGDAEVAAALDGVLARYQRDLAPSLTVTSILRCASPGARPFGR